MDEDALAEASQALVDSVRQKLDPIDGMTALCANARLDLRSQFEHCLIATEQDSPDRWASEAHARQVWLQAAGRGAFMISHVCAHCRLVPMDDFTWFLERSEATKCRAGTKTLCDIC